MWIMEVWFYEVIMAMKIVVEILYECVHVKWTMRIILWLQWLDNNNFIEIVNIIIIILRENIFVQLYDFCMKIYEIYIRKNKKFGKI